MTEEKHESTTIFLFCVALDEEMVNIYEQLKNKNPEWLIQQKIVEYGFDKIKAEKEKE
jgi:hypothetical protein